MHILQLLLSDSTCEGSEDTGDTVNLGTKGPNSPHKCYQKAAIVVHAPHQGLIRGCPGIPPPKCIVIASKCGLRNHQKLF